MVPRTTILPLRCTSTNAAFWSHDAPGVRSSAEANACSAPSMWRNAMTPASIAGRSVGLVATAAASRAGRLTGRLVARGGQREPAGAERRHALAVRVAGRVVAVEAIERVAVVGDLRLSVGALGGCDHRGARAAADRGLAARPQRRPCGGAGPGAGARRPGVLLEQVERAAPRVDEDVAQAGVGDPDRRRLSARSLRGCRGRGTAAATATADGQSAERYHRCAGEECDEFAASHALSFGWKTWSMFSGAAA